MTTYHHGDLRAALLQAAGRIIEREGLEGLSVREAARRAGVSHSAPYRHFPDRDALLAALATEGFAQLGKALENLSGRARGEAYVRFALEHPQRFRLMFAATPSAELEARFAATCAEMGMLGAAAAWSLVHGLAHLILEGYLENSEEFVQKVLGAIRLAVRAQRSV